MSTAQQELDLSEALRLYPVIWLKGEPALSLDTALEKIQGVRDVVPSTIRLWTAACGSVVYAPGPDNDAIYWKPQAKSLMIAEQELITELLSCPAMIVLADNLRFGAHVSAAALSVLYTDRRAVFVSSNDPPDDFLPDFLRVVELVYTREQLESDTQQLCALPSIGRPYNPEFLSPLSGLRPFRMTSTLREAFMRTQPGDEMDYLYEARREAIQRDSNSILSLTEPRVGGFDALIGLDRAKRLFEKLIQRVGESGQVQGVLLCGVPGTGKTMLTHAVAAEGGLPLYFLDIGSAFGSLVGESQRRIKQAIHVLKNSPRGILVLDEIEKALAGSSQRAGSGDSGTAKQVGEEVLRYLDSPLAIDGHHLPIGTSNDIFALPPEFTRAGRWDALFWHDIPSNKTLLKVLKMYAKIHQRSTEFGKKADLSNYTPAEIEAVCRIASVLETDDWAEASAYVPQLMNFRREEISKMREDMKQRAVSADDPFSEKASVKAGGRNIRG